MEFLISKSLLSFINFLKSKVKSLLSFIGVLSSKRSTRSIILL